MDMVSGYDCGDEVADWISEACEVSYLRLIRQSRDDKRAVKKNNEEKNMLSLSNQAQYLLINKATVRWLHNKIQDPQFTDNIDKLTDRFRGNIVINTNTELAELDWHKLIIGKHEFKVHTRNFKHNFSRIMPSTNQTRSYSSFLLLPDARVSAAADTLLRF